MCSPQSFDIFLRSRAALLPPVNLTYSTNPATYVTGTAITPNTPSQTGGAVASYSVSPALPAGLTLNTVSGVITGTPTTATAAASYTITATNAAGFTTASLSITVNTAPDPAAKSLTAFSFLIYGETDNIDETAGTVAVTVPSSAVVTALAATFTTTGASVEVGGTTQMSGITTNDFTSSVTYTVTAADGTTKDYVVTVTISS